MAVRLYPLCSARRVTAPQAPLTAAAALPIHSSTGKVSIVVSLHDPSYFSLGLIRRLTCYRAAKLSTRFPQQTGLLRRFPATTYLSASGPLSRVSPGAWVSRRRGGGQDSRAPGKKTATLRRGPDILVEPEDIRRVVLVLDLRQAGIIVPKGITDPLWLICPEVIDIHPTGGMRVEGLPALAHPRDMLVRLSGRGPLTNDIKIPQCLTQSKGRGLCRDAGGGTVHQIEQDHRMRRGHLVGILQGNIERRVRRILEKT